MLQRIKILTVYFTLCFLFIGTRPLIAQKKSTKIEIPCSNYMSDQNHYRAFESGTSRNLSMARSKARIQAQNLLASLVKSDISSRTELTEDSFNQSIVSKVQEELRGMSVVCQEFTQNEKGEYNAYIAVELPKENLYKDLDSYFTKKDNTIKKVVHNNASSNNEKLRGSDAVSTTNTVPTEIGTYHALLIGIEDYDDTKITNLDQPVDDTQQLYDVLTKNYAFNSKNVVVLKNPSKIGITNELDKLANTLNKNDNLLIFYAGHGFWDENFEQGYWLPSDAKKQMRGSYISNSTIRDYMKGIPSQHILLITDACFSGSIFKSRAAFSDEDTAIAQLYNAPSRVAITSGTLTEVPDKSVFLDYLVKQLKQNEQQYLSAEQLFSKFKIAVMNNSRTKQIPQYGKVYNAGDEGGDFIFIKN
ncbi:MAG: caspase family protein [Winogradskyella sp.]|uniref:caspase family protein n=1 Tax=Winogradskyella sp. TaxID=1883156 RepID=UPI000F3C4EF8|nr:caspase family protein [Winogradskyella sp.]RNC86390.1 MAG: caspase family protein [Winogradskyella sp.]